jgi:hypothetical protein
MNRIAGLLVLSAACAAVLGAEPAKKYRYENISDEEVREIQAVVAEIKPGAIVHIGAVTEGCVCEDGPTCSHEAWIVAYESRRSTGFRMSRMMGHWVIGPLQTWEFELAQVNRDEEAMYRRHRGKPEFEQLRTRLIERREALYAVRPRCEVSKAGGT